MKRFFALVLCFLILSPAAGAEMLLRVVGADDGAWAQRVKMRVADAVISACPQEEEMLTDCLPAILSAAEKNACGQSVRCDIRSWSPEGGEMQDTLYITLGAGEGHNWWGLLYDDCARLCAKEVNGTEEVTYVWPWVDALLRFLGIG